jgi:hypothetical protein
LQATFASPPSAKTIRVCDRRATVPAGGKIVIALAAKFRWFMNVSGIRFAMHLPQELDDYSRCWRGRAVMQ